MSRTVVNFSCGVASAVVAKLVLAADPSAIVVNVFVAEEHEDNRRFLGDVERWIGRTIVVLRDEEYGASAYNVFRKTGYVKGPFGAACSARIKRAVLKQWLHPSDICALGFTADERERAERYADQSAWGSVFPLIDAGLTKADCLALVQRAGLVVPKMYELGYSNANCIGCVKGGAGYWNKIRRDFPERFSEMSAIEEAIGPSAYLFRDRETGKRFSLAQLPPQMGRHSVVSPSCGFSCESVADTLEPRGSPP